MPSLQLFSTTNGRESFSFSRFSSFFSVNIAREFAAYYRLSIELGVVHSTIQILLILDVQEGQYEGENKLPY